MMKITETKKGKGKITKRRLDSVAGHILDRLGHEVWSLNDRITNECAQLARTCSIDFF